MRVPGLGMATPGPTMADRVRLVGGTGEAFQEEEPGWTQRFPWCWEETAWAIPSLGQYTESSTTHKHEPY